MAGFAAGTEVDFDKSIAEMITMVRKAGGQQIGQMDAGDRYVFAFTMGDRSVRFVLPLATKYDGPTKAGNGRAIDVAKVLAQHNRQKGRALKLVIQAKLESVASGIETFEEAFLANVVTDGGATVYERIKEPLAVEYRTGKPQSGVALLEGPRRG